MEGGAHGAFVVEMELTEAAENVVIALDELIGGLDGNVEQQVLRFAQDFGARLRRRASASTCLGRSLASSNAGGGEVFLRPCYNDVGALSTSFEAHEALDAGGKAALS